MGVFSANGCCDDATGESAAAVTGAAGSFATAAVTVFPTIVAISNAAMAAGSANSGFTHSNGILTYTGTDTVRFHVVGRLTGTFATDAGTACQLYILKNGTLVDANWTGNVALDNAAGGVAREVSTSGIVSLATNDTLQLGVTRGTAAGGNQVLTITHIVLSAAAA